jgi:hypothetical protein
LPRLRGSAPPSPRIGQPRGLLPEARNLRAAFGLFFAYYNLVKIHGAIRMTPAMKADLTRKPWSMADLLAAAQGAQELSSNHHCPAGVP